MNYRTLKLMLASMSLPLVLVACQTEAPKQNDPKTTAGASGQTKPEEVKKPTEDPKNVTKSATDEDPNPTATKTDPKTDPKVDPTKKPGEKPKNPVEEAMANQKPKPRIPAGEPAKHLDPTGDPTKYIGTYTMSKIWYTGQKDKNGKDKVNDFKKMNELAAKKGLSKFVMRIEIRKDGTYTYFMGTEKKTTETTGTVQASAEKVTLHPEMVAGKPAVGKGRTTDLNFRLSSDGKLLEMITHAGSGSQRVQFEKVN